MKEGNRPLAGVIGDDPRDAGAIDPPRRNGMAIIPLTDLLAGGDTAAITRPHDTAFQTVGASSQTSAPPAQPNPSVTPTSPIRTTDNVTIAAGTTIYFNGSSGFNNGPNGYLLNSTGFEKCPSLTNAGTIIAMHNFTPTAIYEEFSFQNFQAPRSLISNLATGSIIAYDTGNNVAQVFYNSDFGSVFGSDFSNAGLVEAVSLHGEARAITSVDPSFAFTNTGTVTVWAEQDATGIVAAHSGKFSNSGTIDVTGGTSLNPYAIFDAVAVSGASTFFNSGTIRATSTGNLPGVAVLDCGATDIVNTGTISGDYAFTNTNYDLILPQPAKTLTNSGVIIGDIVPAPSTIHNTGTITGNIIYGIGDSIYDGASGHLNGAIVLGHGNNTVSLGAEDGVVYGGGGADKITGGSGNDFFDITRGSNVIDGKGGVNTLALASSDMGYRVDLGAGTAIGAGTITIANIQQVIGSTFNDTLIAGAFAATLNGGSGNDTLIGGAGNDVLVAGPGGGDSMTGNGGADTFIYASGDGQLVVTDFGTGGDILKVYGYAAAASVTQQGADVLITLSGADSVLLRNVQASSLTSANVSYSAQSYAGPSLPKSQPIFGKDPIQFSYDLTIYRGEQINIAVGEWNYITISSGYTYVTGFCRNDFGTAVTFDNFGAVTVSVDDRYPSTGLVSTGSCNFINESGATFTVSNSSGGACGVAALSVTNAGTISVHNAPGGVIGAATGVSSATVVNRSGGVISVTATASDGVGANILTGGIFRNDGTITVSNSANGQAAYAVQGFNGDQSKPYTIVNTGTLTASGTNGARSYGIWLWDYPQIGVSSTISNSGTISAATAISIGNDMSVAITNSGTIDGDIVLSGKHDTLTNTGTIVGNILCQRDTNTPSLGIGPREQTIDLRNGIFHGSINIASTDIALHQEHVIVLLGDDGTRVTVAGGMPNLTVDVTGGAGNDSLTGGAGNDTLDGGAGIDTAVFSGNRSAYTITHGAGGKVTITGPDGTDTLTHVERLQFADQTVGLVTAPRDFDGDGKSDILWYNANSGQDMIWTMDGATRVAKDSAGGAQGSAWKIIGTGDFDGDGKADMLWEDTTRGQDMIWLMNGTTRTTMAAAGGSQGSQWKIIGTGDFDGDGKSDILWEDTTRGQDMIWLMNGTTRTTMTAAGGSQGSQWKIVGTGDFNGDGKSDILWEDTTRGQDMIWLMNGTTRTTMTAAGGSQGAEWKIVGTGDFDGDGKSDILWENTNTGQDMIWLMDGTTRRSMASAGGPQGAGWNIVGTGDYNGDGKSDILWEYTPTGQDMIWLMDGTTRLSMNNAGGAQGSSWLIVGGA